MHYKITPLTEFNPPEILNQLFEEFQLIDNWMLVIDVEEIFELRNDLNLNRFFFVRKSWEIE